MLDFRLDVIKREQIFFVISASEALPASDYLSLSRYI